nr:hypothetical protein [Egibacter rhizosphaerae]
MAACKIVRPRHAYDEIVVGGVDLMVGSAAQQRRGQIRAFETSA